MTCKCEKVYICKVFQSCDVSRIRAELKIQESASLLQNKTSVSKIAFNVTEDAQPQNRSRLALAHIKDSSGNLPAVLQGFGDGSQLGLRCSLVAPSVPNVMKQPCIR